MFDMLGLTILSIVFTIILPTSDQQQLRKLGIIMFAT